MAGRTATAVTSVSRTALTSFPQPSVAGDVANGNVSPNDGATFLAVFNADGSNTYALTVQVVSGVDGLTAGPRSYTVPTSASGTQVCGPFPLAAYGSQLLWNVANANLKVQPYSTLGP